MQHDCTLTREEFKKAMIISEMLMNPDKRIWDEVYNQLMLETAKFLCRKDAKITYTDDKDISPDDILVAIGPAKPIFKKPPISMIQSFLMLTKPTKNYINVE
jgi:hypothetical protein